MRHEVLTAVKMLTLVFWVVTLCGFAGRYQLLEKNIPSPPSEITFLQSNAT